MKVCAALVCVAALLLPYTKAEWEKLSIFLTFLDMDSSRVGKQAAVKIQLPDEDAQIEPMPMTGGGHKAEPELGRRSNILKTFNDQFGNIPWTDGDRGHKPITENIPTRKAPARAMTEVPPATDVSAQGRRARVSEDLAEQIQAGSVEGTCVIVPGTNAQVDAVAARHGLRIHKRLKSGAVLDVPAGSLGALAANAGAPWLSSNYHVGAHMSVTSMAIGADQVWVDGWAEGASGVTGDGIGVAVIDSGVADVPELRGRIVVSVDFTAASTKTGQGVSGGCFSSGSGSGVGGQAGDDNGHGTHVAGIIAAGGVNTYDDTRGVAQGAHIISLKVLDENGDGFAGDVIEAVDWAIANRERYRIRVINLSLGGAVVQPCADDPVCQAVERAYHADMIVVASGGNGGKDANGHEVLGGITSPGNSPYAITVGALNTKGTAWRSDDEVTTYSSCGVTRFDHLFKPDLVAPGNKIRGVAVLGSTLVNEHPELVIDTTEGKR